jgi:hypothetical protein
MGVRFIRMSRGDGEYVINFVRHHLKVHQLRRS